MIPADVGRNCVIGAGIGRDEADSGRRRRCRCAAASVVRERARNGETCLRRSIHDVWSLRNRRARGATGALRHAIEPMTHALAHRGPDRYGFFDDARVALGHRRLAIIDRAGGTQPMANEDGSCWILQRRNLQPPGCGRCSSPRAIASVRRPTPK